MTCCFLTLLLTTTMTEGRKDSEGRDGLKSFDTTDLPITSEYWHKEIKDAEQRIVQCEHKLAILRQSILRLETINSHSVDNVSQHNGVENTSRYGYNTKIKQHEK